jgi:hypothetical protein
MALALFLGAGCGGKHFEENGAAGGAPGGRAGAGSGGAASGRGGTAAAGTSSSGAGGVNCGCGLRAYVPVCGVDGATYNAVCGVECVPVVVACDGECPCGGTGGSGSGSGGTGMLPACTPVAPAMLCVRGNPVPNGEMIENGGLLLVEVYPEGCWSSSCTYVAQANCSIAAGDVFRVGASFCFTAETDPNVGCTDDCGGGGLAECKGGPLVTGDQRVTLGDLELVLSVPSTLPVGGVCVGSQF